MSTTKTKPKYTPGPWNGIAYNIEGEAFDTVRIKNYECESVCITNRANAALIAAAPEMLEALARILAETNPPKGSKLHPNVLNFECALLVRELIAKARGDK